MEFIARIFLKIVFEIAAYNTGYYVWFIVPTKIQIEPLTKQKERKKKNWLSLTYNRGKNKFLFHDAIVLFGLCVWFVVGVLIFAISNVKF